MSGFNTGGLVINNALDIISYYKKNFKQLGFFPNKVYKRNEQRFTLFSSEVFSKLKDLNLLTRLFKGNASDNFDKACILL